MNPSNDSLKRAWELLRADSIESVDNPLLENRLMNEMKKQSTPRTWKRKLALAAALIIGFLAVGSGIAVAAGYNPFRTIHDFQNGNPVITDDNFQVKSDGADGSLQMKSTEKPK